MPGRILIVHPDADLLKSARGLIEPRADMVHSIRSPDRLPAMMSTNRYDVILLDESCLSRAGRNDQFWVRHIRMADTETVIIVSSDLSTYTRVKSAIQAGAFDVLPTPWPDDLADLIEFVLERRASERARAEDGARPGPRQKGQDDGVPRIIGSSEALRDVMDQVARVARTDANVLILGENGTGKELIARALHRQSARANRPFVSVDMGALTETLFESELFGHERGAFTDAVASRVGKFEAADEGTLFLDEIGNLSLGLQAKLLTALQRRCVVRVGSNREIPVDIQLLCATNKPILEEVAVGRFRQDLLYRINTVEIRVPPLRDRTGDVRPLADHFLAEFRSRYNPDIEGITAAGYRRLEHHAWPGNVRELRHVIQRAVIMTPGGMLDTEHLIIQPADHRSGMTPLLQVDSLDLETVERKAIEAAMHRHHGVVAQAARELGVTRSSLYRRLDKHGLS